jgi:hypothetical protein
MNKTQHLAWQSICNQFSGEELLLEALLRRGFLSYKDLEGVWLGTGSHESDIATLQLIPNLEITRIHDHPDRICKLSFDTSRPELSQDIALAIIALGEHHLGSDHGGFSRTGFGNWSTRDTSWKRYTKMIWGTKLPVCPATSSIQKLVPEALDSGSALLVKSLPLAGIATFLSCDGHGIAPVRIDFVFPWDLLWGKAIFDAQPFKPQNSTWLWENRLEIHPKDGYGDQSVTLLLEDIQQCSRQLLDRRTIHRLKIARQRTIAACGNSIDGPFMHEFSELAKLHICKSY